MPSASTESRMLDVLLASLSSIGSPPSAWLTVPTIAEDIPPTVELRGTTPKVYVEHAETARNANTATLTQHGVTVMFRLWLVASSRRTVCNLKADVLRALFAGENAFTKAFDTPAYPEGFMQRPDMSQQGVAVAELTIACETALRHDNP